MHVPEDARTSDLVRLPDGQDRVEGQPAVSLLLVRLHHDSRLDSARRGEACVCVDGNLFVRASVAEIHGVHTQHAAEATDDGFDVGSGVVGCRLHVKRGSLSGKNRHGKGQHQRTAKSHGATIGRGLPDPRMILKKSQLVVMISLRAEWAWRILGAATFS